MDSILKTFCWSDDFEIGISDVDHQHQKLLNIANRLGNLFAKGNFSVHDIDGVFSELSEYTIYHFLTEERLMQKFSVDSRHFKKHVEIHRRFVVELTEMHSSLSETSLEPVKYLLDFLTHWLVYHILGSDRDMGRQLAAIQHGVEPAAAYEAEETEADSATRLLLAALNGLFEQVSQKNKELVAANQQLEAMVTKRTEELSQANAKYKELSLTDPLTGLPNRRHAMQRLSALWDESVQNNSPLSCIMIDLDFFKDVNDTYGHDIGDVVLMEVAAIFSHPFRNRDVICRLGGDEFFAICPNTDELQARILAESVRETAAGLRHSSRNKEYFAYGISLGVASRTASMRNYKELIKAADRGVYAAKNAGRNCVRSGADKQ